MAGEGVERSRLGYSLCNWNSLRGCFGKTEKNWDVIMKTIGRIMIGMVLVLLLLVTIANAEPTEGEYNVLSSDGKMIHVQIKVSVHTSDLELAVHNSVDNFTAFELFDNNKWEETMESLLNDIRTEINIINAEVENIVLEYEGNRVAWATPVEDKAIPDTSFALLIVVTLMIFAMILFIVLSRERAI